MAPVATPLSATWKKKYMRVLRMPARAARAAARVPDARERAPGRTSCSQQSHVGPVEVLLGMGIDLDMRTFNIELDLKHLAVGPARHDHILLGHRVVSIASEYRSREVLHQALELRDVLEGRSNLLRLHAVAFDRGLEQVHRIVGADREDGGIHILVVPAAILVDEGHALRRLRPVDRHRRAGEDALAGAARRLPEGGTGDAPG